MSRYTYRLTPSDSGTGFLAECVEIDAEGEGSSREAAIQALREAIVERMSTAEAVAPPKDTPHASVELIEAAPSPESSSSRGPQGPGEA